MLTISQIFWLGIYFGAVAAWGWLVAAWVHGGVRMGLAEWLGRLWAYGMMAVAFLQFWGALAGVPERRPLVAALAATAALGLGIAAKWQALPMPIWPRPGRPRGWSATGLSGLALVALLAACATVLLKAAMLPLVDIDAYTLWALKAKVLYHDGFAMAAYFQQPNYGYSHLDYPLLGPFLSAGCHAAVGRVGDRIGKLPMALQYAAFVCLLYAWLRRYRGRTEALLLAASLLALPAFVHWGGGGTMDVLLAMFGAGSVFHLAAFTDTGDARDLRAALVFTAALAFTKNEGIALAAINLAIAGACRLPGDRGWARRLLPLAWCALGVLALWLTWAWPARSIPRIHEDYGGRWWALVAFWRPGGGAMLAEALRTGWARLPEIAEAVGAQFTAWHRWAGFWFILPGLCLLRPRALSRRPGIAILLMLLAHAALYALVFVITPWSVGHLAGMSLERLLLHLAPALVLLAAAPAPAFAAGARPAYVGAAGG